MWEKKIRRARNGRMREAIGAFRGFVRAYQSHFRGARNGFNLPTKSGCHVVQNNSTYEDVILCREITS